MSTNYINQIKDSNNTTQYLADGTDTRIFTGTCSSLGDDSLKEVVLDDPTNFSYTNGTKILVTFMYGNTCNNDYLALRITNVSPVKTLDIFIGTTDDLNADADYWYDDESVLFTYDVNNTYDERWCMTACSGVINYLITKNMTDTRVRQGFVAPGTSSGNAYPLLLCGESGITSTSSRGSISANLNNGLRYTPYNDVLIVNKLSTTNNIPDLFKITTAEKSVAKINAHSVIAGADWAIPSASKPGDGWDLVGIVGWKPSNYRITCQTKYVVDNDTLHCGFSNVSASNVTSSTTFTFYLLWSRCKIYST